MTPRCSTCGSPCDWSDDAWTCTRCGDEWDSDHNVSYVAPAEQPAWEAVRAPLDKRRVVYWRLKFRSRSVGSVSRQYGRWRALGYDPVQSPPNGNVELGLFRTRTQAERAITDHWSKAWKA